MSAKQDRQGARTPADLERRYNFDQKFSEIMGVADEARSTAKSAQNAANEASGMLTQDTIFNLLTNNGESQGIYREDGEIYVNASYIKGGKIISEGQTYLRPTYEDCLTMLWSLSFPDRYPAQDFYDLNGDGVFNRDDVMLAWNVFYGVADVSECVSLVETKVTVTIEPDNQNETVKIAGTNMWGSEVVVSLGINSSKIPVIAGNCSVGGQFSVNESATIPSLALTPGGEPKALSWKDNGDGTFTLIGT